MPKSLRCLAIVASLHASAAAASPDGVLPDTRYLATSGRDVQQFDAAGNLLATLATDADEVRGIGFAPDGRLFAVFQRGYGLDETPSVEAFDAAGLAVRSYPFAGRVGGHTASGKIAFAPGGRLFYVSTDNGVFRFDVDGSAGELFLDLGAYDIDVLPAGDVLVATWYEIRRYSSSGELLSSIHELADPKGLTGDPAPHLQNLSGVDFDESTGSTYVTMIGYTGGANMLSKLIRLEGGTNAIAALENYRAVNDVHASSAGEIVVGSVDWTPALFATDLVLARQLGQRAGGFVTVREVPEASPGAPAALGLALLAFRSRRVRRRRVA